LTFASSLDMVKRIINLHVTFAIVQALTGGGPYFRSQVIEVYIFQTAFQPADGGVPQLGYASAAGCFFGTATLLLALAQLWAAKKVSDTRKAIGAADRKEP